MTHQTTPAMSLALRSQTLPLVFLILLVSGLCAPLSAQNMTFPNAAPTPQGTQSYGVNHGPPTRITFQDTVLNLGQIPEDTLIRGSFRYQNTGSSSLEYISAKSTGGNLVAAAYPHTVAQGQEGRIEFEINTHGRSGHDIKTIRVYGNTVPEMRVLTVRFEVVPRPAPPAPLNNR